MARKSIRENTLLVLSLFNALVMNWLNHINGYRTAITRDNDFTVNGANSFQKLAPRVLGMISVMTRTRNVNTAANGESTVSVGEPESLFDGACNRMAANADGSLLVVAGKDGHATIVSPTGITIFFVGPSIEIKVITSSSITRAYNELLKLIHR